MIKWDEEQDLYLLTPEEFEQLPEGVALTSIIGDVRVKGIDFIDLGVQIFGHMAYGIKNPWQHDLKHLFLIFKLKD